METLHTFFLSTSVVEEHAAMLFCWEAPEMFCRLRNRLTVSTEGENTMTEFSFWVDLSFNQCFHIF